MPGNAAGVLLILAVLAGAVGLLYGLGYLGYRMNAETGALTGGFLGCLALYYGGRFVWRNHAKKIKAATDLTDCCISEMDSSRKSV